ncbi:MAG: CoA transferase [Cohaesibacter sp.]|jgi:crotonobetainyl-CoA:carnitine CoA-transferase CaiB-like acyl-CoA transferase|nr:CoA transferase [Cohaesibacter sp.]
MTGALSHIRVLDLTRVLAGPWSGQLLGDLGADIIKVERPGSGDDTRGWGPPYLKDINGEERPDAAYFGCTNRNKQSVTIDITSKEGQALIRDLVAQSDIVIENYKVGGLKKYGLDYDSLKEVKPDIIYCSITGFGQTGPDASKAGYDFMIQGMGGLMSVTGQPEGSPGGEPLKVGVALADVMTGLYSTIGILAALAYRDETGEGQYIDMALLDVQVAALANQATNYLVSGKAPTHMGNAHPNLVPYQTFPTSDAHFILAVGNDNQFAKFCKIAGLDDLPGDVRFDTNRHRVENREILAAKITAVTADKSLDYWMEELGKAGVPCGPINSIDRVFEEPQVKHRGMAIEIEAKDGSMQPGVACPIKLAKTPAAYKSAPPELGEHTAAVLKRLLGKSDQDLKSLSEKNIITL